MLEQEIKEMGIFVNGLKREAELKKALKFALGYMHKANEMKVFDHCAIRGDNAIEYVTKVLEAHTND
jgi:hypothetical protein